MMITSSISYRIYFLRTDNVAKSTYLSLLKLSGEISLDNTNDRIFILLSLIVN